jgi:hypothetical protein
VIQNNSIVQISAPGTVGQLQCISASRLNNIGQIVAPNRNDITNHPSIVTTGNITDPGFLSLDFTSLTRSDQGVYTCIIPDENGVQQYLHFGIYYGRLNGKYRMKSSCLGFFHFPPPSAALPRVISLQHVVDSNASLALNCTSTGSPAANVIWRKDGASLFNNTTYEATEVLRDGITATYDNLLYVSGSPSELVGRYSCIVHDSFGRNSETATIQVNGEHVSWSRLSKDDLVVSVQVCKWPVRVAEFL